MKRLTSRNKFKHHRGEAMYVVDSETTYRPGEEVNPYFCATLDRLAAIEDILGAEYDLDNLAALVEAQKTGRLVTLPCKVGTVVYVIGGKYRNGTVEKWCNTGLFRLDDVDKLGKTVFLTAEEADEALKTYEVTV